MNFVKVERLALLAKNGDMKAKEELAEEFKPFILNLSKKSYIHGFDFNDIKYECYNSLFKCLKLYIPEKHRFVAYATISIKNAVGMLIRSCNKRIKTEGPGALTLTDNLENVVTCDMDFVEEEIIKEVDDLKLKEAIKELSDAERELIDYVFFREHTLKQYSVYTKIPYSTIVNMKNNVLKKLKLMLTDE